jgi:hypothetical protein
MITNSDFTRTFPPWKSSTKASGVPVCWLDYFWTLRDVPQAKYTTELSNFTF